MIVCWPRDDNKAIEKRPIKTSIFNQCYEEYILEFVIWRTGPD